MRAHKLQITFVRKLRGLCKLELINMPLHITSNEFEGLESIEELNLHGSRHLSYPRFLMPCRLRYLDLSDIPNMHFHAPVIQETPLPHLEVLKITGNPHVSNTDILLLLDPCCENKSLRVLILSMCSRINVDSLGWLLEAGHGDSLEELALAGNSTFGDEVTKELGRLRNLRKLNVAYTAISGIGVLNVVNRDKSKIEWLGIDMCQNVMHDAVDLVKKKGIAVSHRLYDTKGGKRVRY